MKAVLNGREVALVINKSGNMGHVKQESNQEILENLKYGLENSPWRKKVQGLHFYRLKFDILSYELIDDVLHVNAKGKNVNGVKELLIANDSLNDLLKLHWM